MAEPVFQQQGADPLLLLTYGTTTVSTAAFFPAGRVTAPLGLTNSWSTPGVYLFFDGPVTDQAAFVNELRQYLNSYRNQYIRFLWISRPNLQANHWGISQMQVQGSATSSVAQLAFRNYMLSIGSGCAMALDNDGTNYWFTITLPGSQPLFFLNAQWGAVSYPVSGTSIQLSFQQGLEGSIGFTLPLSGTPANATFDTLDMGLRYYINNPDFEGTLDSLRYPMLVNPANAISLQCNLDPVNALNPQRSFFNFTAATAYPLLDSYYRTNLGQGVQLTPCAGSGFVFAEFPQNNTPSASDGYTLVPNGSFTLGLPATAAPAPGAPVARLMLGASGVEYAGFDVATNYTLLFYPGQPAYAPAFQHGNSNGTSEASENTGLTAVATTSWMYITPPPGSNVSYFAQPESSVLYEVSNVGTLDQYLGYLETPSGQLCTTTGQVGPGCTTTGNDLILTAFPAVPYSGIATDRVHTFRLFEQQLLSPTRRALVQQLLQTPVISKTGDVAAVTPQGLKVDLDSTKTYWKSLTLAHASAGSAAGQSEQLLQFTDVTDKFKGALQTNQLFLVTADPVTFLNCASVNFMITRLALVKLADPEEGNVPAAILAQVQANPSLAGNLYADIDQFNTALQSKMSVADFNTYKDVFYKYASYTKFILGEEEFYELSTADLAALNAANSIPPAVVTLIQQANPRVLDQKYNTVTDYANAMTTAITSANWALYQNVLTEYAHVVSGGWNFNMSPYSWVDNDKHPTLFIYKYSGKCVADLAADTSTWVWPEVSQKSGGSINDTQSMILSIINNAIDIVDKEPDFEQFVTAVTDPNWNGILVLNAGMALDELPAELQGLAAGIDASNFYAHHIGVNITGVHNDSGMLNLQDSSVFGLVYYNDPLDQYNEGVDYGFKVLSLKVLFGNSVIANFFSQIEILMNKLFSETSIQLDQTHGNNIILNGTYQKHDGHASYVFAENGDNTFGMLSMVLENVEILQAQFVTVVPPDGLDPGGTVRTLFQLNGRLRFKDLPYFDCFSFGNTKDDEGNVTADGYLNFSNLVIHMEFPQEHPDQKIFTFDANNLSFDTTLSIARQESFYAHFPLQLTGLIQSNGSQTPGDLGFMSTNSPLVQGALKDTWYGFTYDLDLGSLGSLGSNTPFKITLFIGWAPADKSYNVYTGTALPGSSSSSTEIPIEGLLKLAFSKIEITATEVTADAATGAPAGMEYLLKFRGIALSLFGVTFPPGTIDAYIFGNPGSKRSALGWYAAYAKDAPASESAGGGNEKNLMKSLN